MASSCTPSVSSFAARWSRGPAALGLAFALTVAMASAGCWVHAEPEYPDEGYYVDGAYGDVYAAPNYAYGGVNYYWYNDLWWYRYGDRWVVLHNEPPGFYRWRTGHWGYRTPYGGVGRSRPYRAAPAYRAPSRPYRAPPAHRR